MRIRKLIAISGMIIAQGALAVFADTTGMCLDMSGTTDERCACATEADTVGEAQGHARGHRGE